MLDHLIYGIGVALRLGATPPLLALRWAEALRERKPTWNGTSSPDWDATLLSKLLLDELFFASEFISGSVLSLHDHALAREEIEAADLLYRDRGWTRNPERFHQPVSTLQVEDIQEIESNFGVHRHLRYTSAYAPHPDEPGRERWQSYSENRTGHVWLLEHPGAPRPWKICVPGYRMGHPVVDFAGFRAHWLHHELGLNLAIPVMPLHGPRRIGRRSGDGFLSGNILDTVHAQSQGVSEVRALIRWLRERGAPAIGLHGLSLGACTTALVANLEPDLHCVIAGIPAIDPFSLLRSNMPQPLLRMAANRGFDARMIERVLGIVSPLAMAPRIASERLFIYAGRADRLVSPDQARSLWRHWGRPQLNWYDGGHVSFMWQDEVERLILDALSSCGMLASEQHAQASSPPLAGG